MVLGLHGNSVGILGDLLLEPSRDRLLDLDFEELDEVVGRMNPVTLPNSLLGKKIR
jgi:hypothetical protein